ncbi:uncharacterized protein BROUX77_006821 [Berkeleyomyces rouxiae]|uniref:uncharacterized protein n=1 Tax=Berkeleyomyces rouxiae TaxID=2035830 RepID=UPI003B7D357D
MTDSRPAPTAARAAAVSRSLLSLDGGGLSGFASVVFLHELMLQIQDIQSLEVLPSPCQYFHLIGGTGVGGVLALIFGHLQLSTQDLLDVCHDNWSLPIYREGKFFTHLFRCCQARVNDRRPSALHRIRPPLTNARVLRTSLRGSSPYNHEMHGLDPVPETPEHDGGFVHDARCFAVAQSCVIDTKTPVLFRSYEAPLSAPVHTTVAHMVDFDDLNMDGLSHSGSSFPEDYFAQAAKCAVDTAFQFPHRPNRAMHTPEIIDASPLWCNPSELVLKEARDLYGPDDRLGVLVSLGAEPNPDLGWEDDAGVVHGRIENDLGASESESRPQWRCYFRLSGGLVLPQAPVELITHSAILEVLGTAEAWIEDNHSVIEELAQAIIQTLDAETIGEGPALVEVVRTDIPAQPKRKLATSESRKDSILSYQDTPPSSLPDPVLPASAPSSSTFASSCIEPSSIGRAAEIAHSSLLNAARENSPAGREAHAALRLLHLIAFLDPHNIASDVIALAGSSEAVRRGETPGQVSLADTGFPFALFGLQHDHNSDLNDAASSTPLDTCNAAFNALADLGLVTPQQPSVPDWPQSLNWFFISPDMQRHVRFYMGSSQFQESLWAARTILHFALAAPAQYPFFVAQRWLSHCHSIQRHSAELLKRGEHTDDSYTDLAVQATVRARLFAACGFASFAASDMPNALDVLNMDFERSGKLACLDIALKASLLYVDVLLQANRPVEAARTCREARHQAAVIGDDPVPAQKLVLAFRAKEICARLLAGEKNSISADPDLEISRIHAAAVFDSENGPSATEDDVALLLDIAHAYTLLRNFEAAEEVGHIALCAVEHCTVPLSGLTLAVYRCVGLIEAQSGSGFTSSMERLQRAVHLTKSVAAEGDAEVLRVRITLAELALLKIESEKDSHHSNDAHRDTTASDVVVELTTTYEVCRRRFGPRSPLARKALRLLCDAHHANGDLSGELKLLRRFWDSCTAESPVEELDVMITLRIRELVIEIEDARLAQSQLAERAGVASNRACLERLEHEYRCWTELDARLVGKSVPLGQSYHSRIIDMGIVEEAIETISKDIKNFDMAEAVEQHF